MCSSFANIVFCPVLSHQTGWSILHHAEQTMEQEAGNLMTDF